MESPPDQRFILELVVRSSHPALLAGLDQWLQLGLLSDDLVRSICRDQLSCPIQLPDTVPVLELEPATTADFLPELSPELATPERPPGAIARALQSFMAEVSVIWLLFLGVFLVVASSGVLAATQWRNFSPIGQYLILFTYTLAFWGAAVLTGRHDNLRLTSRMLQIATLLIIPVNFWMMDGFRLLGYPGGFAIVAIAAFVLSAITGWMLKPTTFPTSRFLLPVAIGLSWLHFGWQLTGYPLLATYGGTILATGSLAFRTDREGEELPPIVPADGQDSELPPVNIPADRQDDDLPSSPATSPLSLAFLTIAFSTLLLLGRAVFAVRVPIDQLGLAFGICGWLLCWLFRHRAGRQVWTIAGSMLLLLGWAVTVMAASPWQAIGVSGLGLWLLVNYLRRTGEGQYLSAVLLVGLQLVWLLWRLVPLAGRQWVVDAATQLAGPEGMPQALLGLGFLPYVWLIVWLAVRWRRQRPGLAGLAELWALGLGLLLTAVTLENPLIRALNMGLSALTLVGFLWGRSQPKVPLIYLAHGLGLGAIGSAVQVAFPGLDGQGWAIVLLAGVGVEWGLAGLSGGGRQRGAGAAGEAELSRNVWVGTTWYYGLLLAALSYALLGEYQWQSNLAGAGWLLVPLLLTWLGSRGNFFQWRVAGWLSILALVLVQSFLVGSTAGRLLGLGVATLLMLQTTRRLLHWFAAAMTIGFGALLGLVTAWEISQEKLEFFWFLNLAAIVPLLLWLLRDYLRRKPSRLATLYQQASNGWAIAYTGFVLIMVSLTLFAVSVGLTPARWQHASAAAVLLVATGYRLWQSSFKGLLYLAAWSLELLVFGVIALTAKSLDAVGISNLALGLAAQVGGDWWAGQRRMAAEVQRGAEEAPIASIIPSPYFPSLHVIPIAYAALGLLLQHRSFTATTGLFTIAAALVGMGVGRRLAKLRLLAYLSVLGVSFGAYELLVYQLFQAKGGSPGDGFVLLGLLAAGLMLAVYLLAPWLGAYLRLGLAAVRTIAHIHWALGSVFLLLALFNSLSRNGEWWWIGTAILVSAYALALGNHHFSPSPSPLSPSSLTWTYIGITQSLLTLTYLLHLLLPNQVFTDWAGAIACIVAVLLYLAPWQRWGWQKPPFRKTAALLPAVAVVLTGGTIQSLLITAAFYAWLARADRQVRLSYIGLLLANWAIFRLLNQYGLTEPLWFAVVIGLSLLYVAQIDPQLKTTSDREKRHWLRSLATGLVCLTAIYQSEVGIAGLLPILVALMGVGFALAFVAVGIGLKVRAFLYVGTIAFLFQVLRLLWRFIQDYSLLLWAMGIALGLLMIWVAATFEARRVQITSLVNYWANELNHWD